MKNPFTAIIAIILFAAAASGVMFYTQLEQQKSELSSIGKRIESVDGQVTQTKEKITNLKKQNKSLRLKVHKTKDQIHSYNSEIFNLKNENSQFFSKLHNRRISLNNLEEKLNSLINERDNLASKLNVAMSRRQHASEEIIKLSGAKRELEEDIKKYIRPEERVELERIVVKLSQVPAGSIVEINQKYGFAIIDVGIKDGIIIGDVLGVYRDNELFSKVVVEKTFEDFSSVVAAEGFTGVELKISDAVSLIR